MPTGRTKYPKSYFKLQQLSRPRADAAKSAQSAGAWSSADDREIYEKYGSVDDIEAGLQAGEQEYTAQQYQLARLLLGIDE